MNIQKFYPARWHNAAKNRELAPRDFFRSEMDRMFESFFTPFWSDLPTGIMEQMGTGTWKPNLDLHETDTGYQLSVELPGVDEKDINVEIGADNTLVVSGEKKSESTEEDKEKGTYRSERYYGSFRRSLLLPSSIKADEITASFDNGVLSVTIPKGEDKDTRKIAITK